MDTDFEDVIPAEAGIQTLSATENAEDAQDGLGPMRTLSKSCFLAQGRRA